MSVLVVTGLVGSQRTDDGRVLITPGLIDSFELANLDYTVEMIR